MKKYVILTFNVCNMGGGQLFVLRRALHLEKKGFDVCVITVFDNGVFPLKKSFGTIPIYNYPELSKTPSLLSKIKQERLMYSIIQKIGKGDEYYLESHTLETIVWGELLSVKLRGRHLAYPLAEPRFNNIHFEPGKSIIKNKLSRGELYGNNSKSLEHIFERTLNDNLFVNIAFDERELKEICNPPIGYNKEEGDYVITTVSRLDKTYIEPFIDDVKKLSLKYPNQHFVLIIAGGSNTGTREKDLIAKYGYSDIDNLRIIFTGYITELGKDIFKISNVFVGMGTASINAISQKCIALNIDSSKSDKCSGIFGVDTNNFAYTENGKIYSIYEKMEQIYLSTDEQIQLIITKGRKLYESSFEKTACFNQLDSVIESVQVSNDIPEYNVSVLYRIMVRFLCAMKNFVKRMR